MNKDPVDADVKENFESQALKNDTSIGEKSSSEKIDLETSEVKNKSNSSLNKVKEIIVTTTSKIFQDIKFAYEKAYKADQGEQIVADGVGGKSEVKARLANQVAKVKIFWASLKFLPSKILIIYLIGVVSFVIFSGEPSGGNDSGISRNTVSSGNLPPGSFEQRVVSKIGSVIYLERDTFVIDRGTLLHIDGQMYPKGSGAEYIQIGFRCKFIRERINAMVTEVFCRR